jgi:hypothetical protein
MLTALPWHAQCPASVVEDDIKRDQMIAPYNMEQEFPSWKKYKNQ